MHFGVCGVVAKSDLTRVVISLKEDACGMQGPCGRLLLDHWDEGATAARCTCFHCDFRQCQEQCPSL